MGLGGETGGACGEGPGTVPPGRLSGHAGTVPVGVGQCDPGTPWMAGHINSGAFPAGGLAARSAPKSGRGVKLWEWFVTGC